MAHGQPARHHPGASVSLLIAAQLHTRAWPWASAAETPACSHPREAEPRPAWMQGHFISLAFSSRWPADRSLEGVGLVEEPLPVEAGLGSSRLQEEEATFHCEDPWSLGVGTPNVQLPEPCAALGTPAVLGLREQTRGLFPLPGQPSTLEV